MAASLSIKVPVYQTVEARVAEDSSRIMLLGGEREFQKECPVFIYESREEFLEKIETYHVVGIALISNYYWWNGGKDEGGTKKLNHWTALRFLNQFLDGLRFEFVLFYFGWLFDTLIGILTPVLIVVAHRQSSLELCRRLIYL